MRMTGEEEKDERIMKERRKCGERRERGRRRRSDGRIWGGAGDC